MLAECIALGLFLAGLGLCIVTGIQILYALLFGLLCFSVYCLAKGYSARETGSMLWEGISQVRNILIIFVFIGGLTAVWRICGTIPYILYYAVGFIHPRYFVLCTFLLCSSMSFLTGTSFGTASTMGVICMLISNAADLSPFLTGGAILSGSFFRGPLLPHVLQRPADMQPDPDRHLSEHKAYVPQQRGSLSRNMHPLCGPGFRFQRSGGQGAPGPVQDKFLPPLGCHASGCPDSGSVPVASGCKICHGRQHCSRCRSGPVCPGNLPLSLLRCFLNGYEAQDGTRLAQLLNGGGIRSMVKVGIIVLISASYSGIFSHTCLLSGVKHALLRSARRLTPFGTVLVTSVLSCAVSCNQSLATILTCQMCDGLYPKRKSWPSCWRTQPFSLQP